MKIKQIAEKSEKELQALITEKRNELAELAVKYRTSKVSNVKAVLAARKVIARALTIERQRALTAQEKTNE